MILPSNTCPRIDAVVRMLRERGIFVFDVYQGTEDF